MWWQEYKPQWHKQLYRWHWQTAMGAGEYDVPKCAPGTPPEKCVHERSWRPGTVSAAAASSER